MKSSRGSILIAVIWMLSFLALFTVSINRRAAQELMLGRWVKERVITQSLARAGVERAIFEIQSDEFLNFDAYSEPWASNISVFLDSPLEGGSFTVRCPIDALTSSGDRKSQGVSSYRYGACDESARININSADEVVLQNLLLVADPALTEEQVRSLAQSIIDWRDEDDSVMTRGAEKRDYRSLKTPYDPRNGFFETIEELKMVKGMTPELYAELEPYITIYSEGQVNFNTASSKVLSALGLYFETAEKIIEFRRGDDGTEGTSDDPLFQHVSNLADELMQTLSLSPEEFAQLENTITEELVTVSSSAFRIYSVGRLIRGEKAIESGLLCIVNREGDILYWHEGG